MLVRLDAVNYNVSTPRSYKHDIIILIRDIRFNVFVKFDEMSYVSHEGALN